LLCAGALVSACGSSDDDEGSGGNATTTATSTTAAAAEKATGKPITIGLVNQEGTPAGSFSNFRQAAEAAAEYVNNELGGIGDRPIELESCATKASPESSAACANRLVQSGVPAVIGGPDYTPFASYPIYARAKVPVVGGTAWQDAEMASPGAFKFSGGSAAIYPALAVHAADALGAKSVAIIYPQGVAGEQTAKVFTAPVLREKGVDVKLVSGNAASPDWSAAVSAASDADAIIVVSTPQTCVPIMKAYATLGVQAKLLTNGNCFSPQVLGAVGAAADGVLFASQFDAFDPGNPQRKLYDDKIAEYGPSDYEDTEIGLDGFRSVMNIHDLLDEQKDAISAASITNALKATSGQANFLGEPYTCDGSAAPGRQSLCDASSKIVVAKGGEIEPVGDEWVTGAELLPPPERH
jgi:branched-chain amino acid transport system substrate-binding protein